MGNYFNELRWKKSQANYLLKLATHCVNKLVCVCVFYNN